ncbi:hypothetical protein Tcan_01153, partial [Toxocara canis]
MFHITYALTEPLKSIQHQSKNMERIKRNTMVDKAPDGRSDYYKPQLFVERYKTIRKKRGNNKVKEKKACHRGTCDEVMRVNVSILNSGMEQHKITQRQKREAD